MVRRFTALITGVVASVSFGHIGVAPFPGIANTTQEITFIAGHGCSGLDTNAMRIRIPAGVTAVRPQPNEFGKPTIELDALGNVTAVSWQKPDGDRQDSDVAFYKFTVRMRLPNTPFTTIHFLTHQTCKPTDGGTTLITDWVGTMPQPADAGVLIEPAPAVQILPARKAGWNKYTAPVAIAPADFPLYFADAAIVWRGNEAFSANAATTALIDATSGASKLTTAIQAGQEIWVKY